MHLVGVCVCLLCLAITLDVISARVSDGLSRHRLRAGGPDGGRQGGGAVGSLQDASLFAHPFCWTLDSRASKGETPTTVF